MSEAGKSREHKPMHGRDIHEAHRTATPLELLFDLSFVVAIALAGSELHHAVLAGHLARGLLGYLTTFTALWWAWTSFTWFASAYDTDDTPFRFHTMVQMTGVLVLAAGVESASTGDFAIMTVGYVVMRVGLVSMWLRVAREHHERRRVALRQVVGISLVQALWVARLSLPSTWAYPSWALLMACEFAVPLWAMRAGKLPWHAHHIAERYGLFTIIVLGECVLGATQAVAGVIHSSGWSWDVVGVGFGSTVLVFALWWVYFLMPFGEALHHHRERVRKWGMGHVVVFASLAAMGSFLGVIADLIAEGESVHTGASPVLAIALMAGAVVIYLTTMWWLGVQVVAGPTRNFGWVWLLALGLLACVVAGVAAGLPLPWAVPAVAMVPVLLVVAFRLLRGTELDAAKQRGRINRRT